MIYGESAQPSRETLFRAYGGLLLMVVIWGANFSVAKVALATVPPLAFNALRFPFAALAVLVLLRLRGPIPLPEPADVSRIVVLGLLGNVLYQQFFIFGLHHTNAGIASVLLAGTPILTALVSAALGHERVRPRAWIGVAATFFGILLVVRQNGAMTDGGGTMVGGLLMIGASVAWAAYTVGARPLLARYGALRVTAWTLWVGTTMIVLIGLPQALSLPRSTFTPEVWLAVLYAGALSIGIAYMIWYNGVRVIGNTRTAAYSNMVPVVALAVAWLWLGEVPSAGELLGSGIIIGGVTLAQTGR